MSFSFSFFVKRQWKKMCDDDEIKIISLLRFEVLWQVGNKWRQKVIIRCTVLNYIM